MIDKFHSIENMQTYWFLHNLLTLYHYWQLQHIFNINCYNYFCFLNYSVDTECKITAVF